MRTATERLSWEAEGVLYRLTVADCMSRDDVVRVCREILMACVHESDAVVAAVVREIANDKGD